MTHEDIEVPHIRAVLARMAGSASLACWIVLLLPQLIEQWRLKSSDGIAIGFLTIWILGDLTNLAGALWAGLRPEVILLALWYCFADGLIMASYFYYKNYNKKLALRGHHHHHHHHHPHHEHNDEGNNMNAHDNHNHGGHHHHHHGGHESSNMAANIDFSNQENDSTRPLLDRRASSNLAKYDTAAASPHTRSSLSPEASNRPLSPPHHHHHHHDNQHNHHDTHDRRNSHIHHKRTDSLSSIVIETSTRSSLWQRIIFPVLFVLAAGILGYFFSQESPDNSSGGGSEEPSDALGPQILGYVSAILYLSARIPQIIQNHRRRSVRGLSLVFFIFSLLGNITYALGILIYRTDPQWIRLYFSWLLGSLGTILEDAVIFLQFYIYENRDNDEAIAD